MKSPKLTRLAPWEDDEATVVKTIKPQIGGRIRFRGTEWPARCLQDLTVPPGTIVRVIGHFKITWYVEIESVEAEFATANLIHLIQNLGNRSKF